ncbi:PD-(D/E)XK nuclease family protein [Dyadobacter sp. CY326]|uniref:PD-(D/E)XK nuclease family protein n=1 Tax=Dyadobacter sp. CY326 TaxID=2907300 RepID=UPI001F19B40E|nr:PD-(D/E)XK nuclease family protein [Dyadobacter sp. CY326]MCE7066682.1 PD-(D/E)XK nuclease family protein [Dyadobacter sp. CY326]
MIKKVKEVSYRKISRISPSQFYSMRNCAYKMVLAEAFEKKPLLPASPNAYLGTVLHKVLEMTINGIIKNKIDFDKAFDEHIIFEEERLIKDGYAFFVPLRNNVLNLGIKKILLLKHLKSTSQIPNNSNKKMTAFTERWLESDNKKIAGKVDLITEEAGHVQITDFKTGRITEEVADNTGALVFDIKSEYKHQMKLYAYLYYEQSGQWPNQLVLADLTKQKFSVEFTAQECTTVYEEAIELLRLTNECIETKTFSADPSPKKCGCCLYRPGCSFYLEHLKADYSFQDVIGVITSVVRYLNGNVTVLLHNKDIPITITSFPREEYDEFNKRKGKQISIFNVKKEKADFLFSASKKTIIYE